MNSNNQHPESDCGNYPTPAPVAELPKEAEGKAKKLLAKFSAYTLSYRDEFAAKQCALIECNDILSEYEQMKGEDCSIAFVANKIKYWQQVRTAINQL